MHGLGINIFGREKEKERVLEVFFSRKIESCKNKKKCVNKVVELELGKERKKKGKKRNVRN